MNSQHFQGLVDGLRGGDVGAADRLRHVLRPVVARAVRRALETADAGSPLGRRVHQLLGELTADAEPPCSPLTWAAPLITRTICDQTVARLRCAGTAEPCLAETVCT